MRSKACSTENGAFSSNSVRTTRSMSKWPDHQRDIFISRPRWTKIRQTSSCFCRSVDDDSQLNCGWAKTRITCRRLDAKGGPHEIIAEYRPPSTGLRAVKKCD